MNMPSPPPYLRDLPLEVRQSICRVLDEDRLWEALVQKLLEMKINITTVGELENTDSPANKLFLKLMNHNFKEGPLKIATFYKISTLLKSYKLKQCLAPYVTEELIQKLEVSMKRPTSNLHQGNNFGNSNIKPANTAVYLHQLPEDKKARLCVTLTHNDAWKHLSAKFEKFGLTLNHMEMCEMNCPSNPARELFKLLADRNIKIPLLYIALASMDLPEAMSILQCYVSENLMKKVQRNFGHKNNGPKINNKPIDDNINQESKSSEKFDSWIKRDVCEGISYRELEAMTNNWDEINRLGSNGRGNFYRGLRTDGTLVAIKRLIHEDEKQSSKVLEELRQLEHFAREGPKSLLQMLMIIEGVGDSNPCIIYPFKERRSLYDHLLNKGFAMCSGDATFCWKQKQIIALGVTEALIYLQRRFGEHTVIVKSSDIILDDTMEPLVADVCLPSTLNRNSSEYLAMYKPQSKDQKIKSFCLGTILLELATGDPADKFSKHPGQLTGREDITMKKDINGKFRGLWKGLILNCTQMDTSLPCVLKELKAMLDS